MSPEDEAELDRHWEWLRLLHAVGESLEDLPND